MELLRKQALRGLAIVKVTAVLLLLVNLILNVACGNGRLKVTDSVNAGKIAQGFRPVPFRKPPASFPDTLTITGKVAVFFQSDSLQLEKTKALLDRDHFETEIHNCFYLMRNARRSMAKSWPAIRIKQTAQTRYLRFVKEDERVVMVDLDKENDLFGIFLFDGEQDPELADLMNIDSALGFYFRRK